MRAVMGAMVADRMVAMRVDMMGAMMVTVTAILPVVLPVVLPFVRMGRRGGHWLLGIRHIDRSDAVQPAGR